MKRIDNRPRSEQHQQGADNKRDVTLLTEEKRNLVERIKTQRDGLQVMREKLPNIRHVDKRKITEDKRSRIICTD